MTDRPADAVGAAELGAVDAGAAGAVDVGAGEVGALEVGALEPVAAGTRADPLPHALTASAAVTAQMTALDRITVHLPRT